MKDIIERLNDPELYVDAIDDAITEIERLRAELTRITISDDELRTIIYNQLTRANAKLPGVGKGKFSKDLVKMIQHHLAKNNL